MPATKKTRSRKPLPESNRKAGGAAKPFDISKVKMKKLVAGDAVNWEKSGQQVVGRYIGFRKQKTVNGESLLHGFTDSKGTGFELWESTSLKTLRDVPIGTIVSITYLGKKKSKSGKRSYNSFEISLEAGVELKS